MDDAVTSVAGTVDPLCFKLRRTRRRGIYRSGERYVVPFVDSLGADRVRDFATLSEARDFRDVAALAANFKPGHEPMLGERITPD